MNDSNLVAGVLKIRAHAEQLLGQVDEAWPLEELLRMLGSDRVAPSLAPDAFTLTTAINEATRVTTTGAVNGYEAAILSLVRDEVGANETDERLDRAILLAVGHVVADMY